jgi:hypothetical protein
VTKPLPITLEQLRLKLDGGAHSIFGPSGSGMYLNCAGSLVPNLLAPDDAGIEAAYGVVGHEVVEQWLLNGAAPRDRIGERVFVPSGEWGFHITIDEEMLGYAAECVDWVEWLPGTHFVEQRVDFSRITPIPNQTGTADFIAIDEDTIYVVDWKMGTGVKVFAEYNTQAMLYALGSLWKFDPENKVKKVIIRIGQPRLGHFDEWETDRDTLMMFAGEAKVKMAAAWRLDAPRTPGEKQCRFCRVRTDCAALAKYEVELTDGVFDNLDEPIALDDMAEFHERLADDLDTFKLDPVDVTRLSLGELAQLHQQRRTAERWWNAVDVEMMKRTKHGENLQQAGFKIVEGRAIRVFQNDNRAIEHLQFLGLREDQIVESKIISPAKAEELLRKQGYRAKVIPSLLDGYTKKPPGKPTIVPLSDKREAIGDLSEGVFDNLDHETTEDEEM